MNFLISLVTAILLIAVGRNFIKKHANICYIASAIVSIGLVVGYFTGALYSLPSWFSLTILPLLTKSSFATALFVIVMYTGAFKNGSKLIKYLMPIRAELSIIASILTLAHNITFGRHHFVTLFTAPNTMSLNMMLAAIISLIMILIMIPLFVTSFPKIRKAMSPKKWKKLQRLAYLFYGLIYLHVMLLMIPVAKSGDTTYIVNVLVYSIVYLTYGTMRLTKHFAKKNFSKYIVASPVVASILGFIVVGALVFYNPTTVAEDNKVVVDSVSDEIEDEEDNDSNEDEEVDTLSEESQTNDSKSNTSKTPSSTSNSSSSTVNNSSSNNSSQNTTNSTSNITTSKPTNSSSNSGNSSNTGSSSSVGSTSNTGNSSNSNNNSSNDSSSNGGSSSNIDSSGTTSNEGNTSNDAVSGATQHTIE